MLTYPPVKKVSVVIPVYNEQDSLPELLLSYGCRLRHPGAAI